MLTQAPPNCSGVMRKQTHGAWVRWTQRHFLLKDGCLYWSKEDMDSDAPSPTNGGKQGSCIDFSLTPCLVRRLEYLGNAKYIIIRPVSGYCWNKADQHRGAQTSRMLVLDAGDETGRWYERLQQHIAYGKAQDFLRVLQKKTDRTASGKRLRFELVSAERLAKSDEDCPICLEKLNGSVVEAVCKHKFHAVCVHEWTLRSAACPLCRGSLQ